MIFSDCIRRGSQLAICFIALTKRILLGCNWPSPGPGFSSCDKQGHLWAARRLLIAVAALVAEYRPRVLGLQECGSQALEHRMDGCAGISLQSSSAACGSSNSVSSIGRRILHSLSHQGKSY